MKNRVFIDMDGVIVDFDAHRVAEGKTADEIKQIDGAYLAMPPIPGAIAAVRSIEGMGFEVWIATKPPTGVAHAYRDKAQWVLSFLPELKRRIIVTHDKGLLGCEHDYLIDDRPHKANCTDFRGKLIVFTPGAWPEVLELLRSERDYLSRRDHSDQRAFVIDRVDPPSAGEASRVDAAFCDEPFTASRYGTAEDAQAARESSQLSDVAIRGDWIRFRAAEIRRERPHQPTNTVADISDAALVECAVRNAERDRVRTFRWAHVRDAFALGSNYAQQLCARFNLDPDEMVGVTLDEPESEKA